MSLFPSLCSGTLCQEADRGHSGNIYTTEMGKPCRSGLLSTPPGSQLLNTAQHTTVYLITRRLFSSLPHQRGSIETQTALEFGPAAAGVNPS